MTTAQLANGLQQTEVSVNMSACEMSSGSTPDVLTSDADLGFLRSLYDFIEREKRCLQCPEAGPDELRYVIYRSAFNSVISRSTAYKRLLLTIKAEYDATVRELRRREDQVASTRRTQAALAARPAALRTCGRRAAQLRARISALHRETAELEDAIQRRRSLKERSTWIPGLTVAESEDAEALDQHLELLQGQRDALLHRKSCCVSLEVKAELETKLQASEKHREQLSRQNERLSVLHKRLRFVCDRLSSWEEQGRRVPLEELLGSALQSMGPASATDDGEGSINTGLFDDKEPSGGDESTFLTDYLHRFTELFESAQYEAAALLAARSPLGVLRNLDTMDMFTGATGPGPGPPPLLFSQALLITAAAGAELAAPLSVQVVRCALQYDAADLVTHAVTHSKLTSSEVLGDVLTEHAQRNPTVADLCLALATAVYEACGLTRKTALSMCRRGLIHSAAEVLTRCKDVTADDCLWILRRSPSLALLRRLTGPGQRRAAVLSAGVACRTLLSDAGQQDLALQLLDGFISEGREVLEEVMLKDCGASVDVWTDVSSLCCGPNRSDLSRAILSILLDLRGTRVLSPDAEGARLMEHVFL